MRSIDGQILRQMLISAANNLYNHYPEIDALNVFPVPDGDTGMNMNLTLASGAKEIANRNDEDVYTIANTFSRGLLMGARGNSGVITSQIFRGIALSLKDKKTIKATDLAEAFANGSTVAYKAVMRPVEGTILTVIRESSEALSSGVKGSMSIEETMELLVKEANASLKRTPELLPVLKEVGVVDSGGAGLVTIMEGMLSALNGKFIEKKEFSPDVNSTDENKNVDVDTYKYSIEFTLKIEKSESKKPFAFDRFKTFLESKGLILSIKDEKDTIIVSMRCKAPGSILTYSQNYGEFFDVKIINLSSQSSTENKSKEEVKPSSKKIELVNDFGLVAISAGKGIDTMFSEVGVNEIVTGGQTMNPSIEDIISAVRNTKAKTVFVFPNNSNIIMAALQAADVLTDEIKVYVVPTKTIPQGIVAASAFSPDLSGAENFKNMKDEIKHIQSGSITYAIKDTVIDGVSITKDYFMAIQEKKIIACEKSSLHALYKLVGKMVNDETFLITILIGEGVSEKDEKALTEKLKKKYDGIELDIRHGDQPVYSYLVGVE